MSHMRNHVSATIRSDDYQAIKSEAATVNQPMVDFMAIMLRAWRNLTDEQRWAFIREHGEADARASATERATA